MIEINILCASEKIFGCHVNKLSNLQYQFQAYLSGSD